MKGNIQLVLLLGAVTLLCAAFPGKAALVRQSSVFSIAGGEKQEGMMDGGEGQETEEVVIDGEQGQEREEVVIGEEGQEREEDLIERDDLAQGSGEVGNSNERSNSAQNWGERANFTEDCVCGEQPEEIRIVGGVPTTRGRHPWMAALLEAENETLICGGTLINNLYILTAAHCFTNYSDPASILVRLRDYNLSKPDQHKEITKTVIDIIIHKKFDPSMGAAFDIALLKLEDALSLSQLDTVGPICLPSTKTELYEKEKAIATGWGTTNFLSENPSSILNEVKIEVISNDHCRNTMQIIDPSYIENNMMCAGKQDKNICVRDDGGPLAFLNSNGYYEQIGVTSFSIYCGLLDVPAVFTRVNKFLTWIERNTEDATYCRGFSFPG